jgi:hypothetical protein
MGKAAASCDSLVALVWFAVCCPFTIRRLRRWRRSYLRLAGRSLLRRSRPRKLPWRSHRESSPVAVGARASALFAIRPAACSMPSMRLCVFCVRPALAPSSTHVFHSMSVDVPERPSVLPVRQQQRRFVLGWPGACMCPRCNISSSPRPGIFLLTCVAVWVFVWPLLHVATTVLLLDVAIRLVILQLVTLALAPTPCYLLSPCCCPGRLPSHRAVLYFPRSLLIPRLSGFLHT